MKLLPVPHLKRYLKNIDLLIFFGFLLLNYSCKQAVQPKQSSHVVNRIITKTNDLVGSGHLKQAVNYIDSAYSVFPDPGVYDLWLKYNFEARYYLEYQKNPAKAMGYADSMIDVLKGHEQEYKSDYASTLFSKGNILLAEHRDAEAFKSYFDGKQFAQKNLDSCSYCQLSYQLGMVWYKQRNFLQAVPYFKQAFAENGHCKPGVGFDYLFIYPQSHLNTIGLCFEQAGMPDSAIYYYKKALGFVDQRAPRFPEKKQFVKSARSVIYGNMGGSYAALDDFQMAKSYLLTSIRLNDHPDNDPTAHLKLADLYIRFSDFNDAEVLLGQIEKNLYSVNNSKEENEGNRLKWNKLKWAYFDKTHQLPQAYQFEKKYYALRDSLDLVKNSLKNQDIDIGFKDVEQQYQLALLNKDNQLKTVYLTAIIVFAVMVLFMLLMTWNFLKHSRRNVRKLTEQNQIIKEQNIQMQNALDSLVQSQEENTQMMNIVAHDLRSPISGITMAASKMLNEPNRSEKDHLMLNLIKTSGKNSLTLVTDLLQVNTRVAELKKEPVDMHALLRYCVDLLRLKAEEKKQRIILDAGRFTLYVNREKMWRVISNLITNAIKFSPSGTTINVSMLKKEDQVIISVDDRGIGIPEHLKDKIFDMFTEGKRPGTIGEQPFGIGLAICKQIVEAHGGMLWFESRPGKGTSFNVELPIKPRQKPVANA